VPPLPLAREGGEVEIVLLAVFQRVSATRLGNILGNVENNRSM
jgi:hypothetical protein